MASSSSEPEQDQEPDEPSTIPSPPSFRFDQNNMSTQSLLSAGGSGYESQYGSLFGSRFSLTDGSGIFVSSLALTIIISAIAIVGIVLVTVIITLAVMLSSCEQHSTLTLERQRFDDFCSSFHLNVELNNVQGWAVPSVCESNVFNYVHGGQYIKDIEVAVDSARRYLKTLTVEHDQSYGLVLDIDETALSNSHHYENLSYGSKGFVDYMWGMWMNKTKTLPMVPVLDLYHELRAANWSIFFISERPESALDLTVQNLKESGYEGWRSLLLRSVDDAGLTVQAYKSNKRIELEKQGYRILSVLGDQWSDIVGPATGARTFKLPNPMYQIL